jgi:hypothetical protein
MILMRLAVAVVGLLAFFPVAAWVSSGVAAPDQGELVSAWTLGLLPPLGAVVIFALGGGASWNVDRWRRFLPATTTAIPVLLTVSLAGYALVALAVFDGLPLHVDSMTQAVQARIFASGRLWLETPEHPEFTSTMHMLDRAGRTYSQFPPGWPAALAVGTVIGVPWLVAPIFATIGVACFYSLCRSLGESRGLALCAAALLAVCPWYMFSAGSQMNHLPALTLLLAGSAALVTLHASDDDARPRLAFLAGALLGAAAWIRPLEAAAFALPALVWTLARTPHRARRALALVGGLGATGTLLLAFNALVNGSPFTWAYDLQWGSIHGLGFHEAPFGPRHTPARGLGLVNKYLLQMQVVLFEGWAPGLLAPLAALLLSRKVGGGDRYLLGAAAGVLAGYFAYWHDGDDLGPRFLLPLAPLAVLWTVRLPGVMQRAGRSPLIVRGTAVAIGAMIVLGCTLGTPARWRAYSSMAPARRLDVRPLRSNRELQGALVLVPASWGTQVRARMWARGLPRHDTEWIYGRTDLCELDFAVARLEREQVTDPLASARRLMPLTSDSAKVRPTTLSPDTTEMMREGGAYYPSACQSRLREERGEISMLHFLPQQADGPRFVRDMHERNFLLEESEDVPVYRLELPRNGLPSVRRIDLDSARYQWRAWLDAAGAASGG